MQIIANLTVDQDMATQQPQYPLLLLFLLLSLSSTNSQSTEPLNSYQIARQATERSLGNAPPLPKAKIDRAMERYYTELSNTNELLGKQNQQAAKKYLINLKQNKFAVFAEKDLVYIINQKGHGPKPKQQQQIRITYVGKHLDGAPFDQAEQAAWLSIRGIFPGWREAVLRMSIGSNWTIVVPPHLAYGETGVGDIVGPFETLLFDLGLLDIR